MKPSSIYPGWHVLAATFICAAVAIGFTSYIYGMFTVPVTEEFGISRGTYNNGMIGLLIGNLIASLVLGKLLDRVPARLIFGLCALGFGGGLTVISQTDSLPLMLVMIVLPLAFGSSGCGVLGANTVLVRWFQRRRGRALGVLALSTSVGGFISQPLTAFLIESFGWRNAVLLIGLVAMVIFLFIALFVIRDRPSEESPGYAHEFIDHEAPEEAARIPSVAPVDRTWSYRELIGSRNFWLVAIGIGLLFGIDQAVLISQVPYFQDIGYELQVTAFLVAVKTISAIGGKLLVGYLAERVDLRFIFAYVAGSNALLLSVYILQPSFWWLVTAIALLGVAVGGVFPAWSTILAWLFGPRSYGSVMGLMAIIMQPLAIVATRFIGEVYDHSGSYIPAFALFIALGIVAIGLISMVRPDKPQDEASIPAEPAVN